MQYSAALKDRITQCLTRLDRIVHTDTALPRAAVTLLVSPTPDNREASVLLTRRAAHLRRHAGQYALPGGRADEGESTITTALRECHEEIGLALHDHHVVGLLDDFITRSGFCITPVVACTDVAPTLTVDEAEVEKIFHITLEELASAATQPGEKEKSDSDTDGFSIMLPTVGHRIYAPTAAILFQFREVALLDRRTRVHDLEQPRFAWQ
ncbi:MAG TPA: CoA pyrophosphatase [Arenicellales bacterium]|jgi:8-oxo-dGTP pyrophosphatase MutT (NUDIX family)|nr:CoA pyrophosphatase [Arenicellales bacterium]